MVKIISAASKIKFPSWSAKKGWVGGDAHTLFAFFDPLTGKTTVRPGNNASDVGPEVRVAIATVSESAQWQDPAKSNWQVMAEAVKRGNPMITSIALNKVFQAYVEAALWSSSDDEGEPLDRHFDSDGIDADTRKRMLKDCSAFLNKNEALLDECGLDWDEVGHNFWLSRNGHGTGFFDKVEAPLGDQLQEAAEAFAAFDLYVGDDGYVHGSGGPAPRSNPSHSAVVRGGKVKQVKNLGWLLKHWQDVSSFTVSPGARGNECLLVAHLRSGGEYVSDFADSSVLKAWLNRPVFKGVPVRWTLQDKGARSNPKRRNPEPCRDCGAANATTEVGDQGVVCTKCARRYSPCAVCKTKLLPENLTTVGGRELCEPCEEDVRYKNMPRDNGKARKNPHSGTDTPRIYVADLGAYNAGKLKGRWIDVVADEDAMAAAMEAVAPGREVAVHDYDNFVDMGEYPSAAELAAVSRAIHQHGREAVKAAMAYDKSDWQRTLEDFEGEFPSEEDFARQLLDDVGISKEQMKVYFDYEALGRDLQANGEDEYLEMSAQEAGEQLVEDLGDVGQLKDPSQYFDYEAFARDLFINDYCAMDCKGGVCVFRRT